MKTLIIGFGIQGKKRLKFAGSDAVGIVDPYAEEANYKSLFEVPTEKYNSVVLCTPDNTKYELLKYILQNGKHALVEKPLFVDNQGELENLELIARNTGAFCYTAYNHRFEPHIVRMRELIISGKLGKIYRCRMFYGNGTARLVRTSDWRDQGSGVLPDLGSHLLDITRFWFGDIASSFCISSVNNFENHSPDHVVIISELGLPRIELEMTLLSWRNHFTCDIFAENGSAHIESLCKWGPTSFTVRTRILPSGRPTEEKVTLIQEDPTWISEYAHFKKLSLNKSITNLQNDIWLNKVLKKLETEINEIERQR